MIFEWTNPRTQKSALWTKKLPIFLVLLMLTTSGCMRKICVLEEVDLTSQSSGQPVWHWFAKDGPHMTLQVFLDHKLLYETNFHVCQVDRSLIPTNQPTLHYFFKAPRAISWEGYKDEVEITPANLHVDGDIWLAGSDPGDMILGVSFNGTHSIYMNTLLVAYPDQQTELEIATGLVVVTRPRKAAKTNIVWPGAEMPVGGR